MKKILNLVLAISLILTLAMFTAPPAFADGGADVAAAETTAFVVEKHPTDETIPAGGKAIFMAYPKGTQVYSVYWTFETDDGDTVEAENAPNYFSGLIVEFPDKQRIRLKNVPETMSGLKVRAHFAKMNGETIVSDPAFLFVEPGENNPAPCNTAQAPVSTASQIVITKHPLDEVLLRDGQSSTYFTSYATGYSWISWEFKIGDNGGPFSAEKAISDYGLCLEGINSEKITIRNITWGINGWYVRAVFHDDCGNVKYSNWAFMRLVECTPCNPCPPKPCRPCPCEPVCPPPCWAPDPYCDPYCGVPIAPCTPCEPAVIIIGGCTPPVETTVTHSESYTVTDTVSTTYYGW